MTPGEVTVLLRAHADRVRAEQEREVRHAWMVATLQRAKRVPTLRRLLPRRRRRPATYAPASMSEERRRRLELLARGLTLAEDIDPYARPEDDG